MRRVAALVLTAGLLLAAVGRPDRAKAPRPTVRDEMGEALNLARYAAHRAPVARSRRLDRLAQHHARRMALTHHLSHSAFRHRFDVWGGEYLNENVAYLPSLRRQPDKVVRKWLGSDMGHRENLLSSDATVVGFGVARGFGRTYYMAILGRP